MGIGPVTCSYCRKPIHPGERFDKSPLGPIAHYRCLPVVNLQPRIWIPAPAVEVEHAASIEEAPRRIPAKENQMSRVADFLIDAEDAVAAGRATPEQFKAVRAFYGERATETKRHDGRRKPREYDWAYRPSVGENSTGN